MQKDTGHFRETYANWKGLKSVCLTFDVDFAPDYMIQRVLNLLSEYEISATFYATHFSPLLEKISRDPRYEVGLHPNLKLDSTQGVNTDGILNRLQGYFPEAVGNRFHILKYSYRDLFKLGRRKFLYDVSTLRFNTPYLLPAWHQDIEMLLLTYSWEDGICENAGFPMKLDYLDLDSPGVKIINFHPINVFMNGEDASTRLKFMKENPDLLNCPESTAKRYQSPGQGAGKLLVDLLESLRIKSCRCISVRDLAQAYKQSMTGTPVLTSHG